MIKLEKNFIGEVCENCNMLQAYAYTMCVNSLDSVDKNIIVNVGCENHDICITL